MPFFSVVIPTRNRPELVKHAIDSVLAQDFRDYEVVVSDNSDDAMAQPTRIHVEEVLQHPQVRYIRPLQVLSMSDHWEWAMRQTHGEFSGVLTDRMLFKHYTLGTIHGAMQGNKPDLISFLADDLLGESPPFRLRLHPYAGTATIIRSKDILADCVCATFSERLPRMSNSFCRTEKMLALIPEYGTIFASLSPDYAFCFRMLDQLKVFTSLDHRLLVRGWEARSNGHNRDFIRFYSGKERWFEYTPIPSPTPANAILLEYEAARIHQRSGRFEPIDKASIYYRELQNLFSQEGDTTEAAILLERFRQENGILPAPVGHGPNYWRYNHAKRIVKEPLERAFEKIAGPLLKSTTDHINIPIGGKPVRGMRYRDFNSVDAALCFDARYFGPPESVS
uniref:Glycosyl transferase family 2 n=1 Tax=Candidatus Kentrum sp. DK TaxID=2126562 RepID=A0A450T100_9GAMM|nr:MAG: Glycosyl transferase family 2 [Candidatus Kentron sp. DK]